MHYDFKMKLNKIDSQQYRNLLVPEIDWILNEAQELFIKLIAEPRNKSINGFEKSQRNTEDIRSLIAENQALARVTNTDLYLFPSEYWYYLSGTAQIRKGDCPCVEASIKIRQHDDDFEESPFDSSSYEWRTLNAVFNKTGLRIVKSSSIAINGVNITYIKIPRYMHNAEDFRAGGYSIPGRAPLTGTADCELPSHTHREIVDIAALIATGQIQAADYQIKMAKLQLNDIKA